MRRIFPLVLALLVMFASVPVTAQEQEDTDGDGLPDAIEDANGNGIVDEDETDPFNADSDRGGEADGSEVTAGRDPLSPTDDLTYDADGDGWVNGIELLRGTNPQDEDSDDDGVKDSADPFPLNPHFYADEDKNGLPDEWESQTDLSSFENQTQDSDPDEDGLTNGEEFEEGTDPLDADSDLDGVPDDMELTAGTNPRENACLVFGPIADPLADADAHWSKEYVARLQRTISGSGGSAVIGGYEIDGSMRFLPDREVTRFEFLKMVLLTSCIPLSDATIDVDVRFSDVRSVPDFEETADAKLLRQVVYTAVLHDIVEGYPDGTFRPDATINRAEALKILMQASGLFAPVEATNMARIFPDVPEDAWFRGHVSTALWYEIVRGYEDGTFKPGNFITRAEAAKMAYLTMTVNPRVNGYIFPPL